MRRFFITLCMAMGIIIGGIALLPLRWFVPEGMLAARAVSGTIWAGRIEGATLGPLRLGDVRAGLRWPGRMALALDDPGQADPLRAFAMPAGNTGAVLDEVNGTLQLGVEAGPLLLESVRLRNARIDWQGECRDADGRLTLVAKVAALSMLPPVSLGGGLRCEAGNLVTRLKSQSGLELADVTLFPNGRWSATLTVRPPGPELAAALLASGFAETPLGYARSLQGEMR